MKLRAYEHRHVTFTFLMLTLKMLKHYIVLYDELGQGLAKIGHLLIF